MRVLMCGLLVVGALAAVGVAAQEETVYEAGPGIVLPRVVKEVKPQYTPRAMEEGVEGAIWLRAVVRTDGSTSNHVIAKGLHPELDEKAIEALRQWQFEPGQKDGKAVPVRITVELTFKLKS